MGFFKDLFRKSNSKDNGSFIPSRDINLHIALEPENGAKLAEQFVDAVKNIEKIELDYSIASLEFVEIFLQRFRNEGLSVNDFAETIFVAGAYVGEVMIRNNDGYWISQEEASPPNGVKFMPIVVKLQNDNIADPIAKAFKRFHFGEADSIRYFYYVFTKNTE